jgi:hypothetical protein
MKSLTKRKNHLVAAHNLRLACVIGLVASLPVNGAMDALAATKAAKGQTKGLSKPAIKVSKTLLTPAQLVEAIKRANIVTAGCPIDATVGGLEIVISTYRRPKAFDHDCKIDAVLIAKQIVDLDPKNIERVSVIFQDSKHSNRYHKVVVTAADVVAFGAGQINQDKFLDSLAIVSGTEPNVLIQYKDLSYQDILDGKASWGMLTSERQQAYGRIRVLEKRGLAQQSVSEDMDLYLRIEDLCRRQNQFEAKAKLDALNRQLAQQEQVTGFDKGRAN